MPAAAAPPSATLSEHLSMLSDLPAEYLSEFCKAAMQVLQQQAPAKMFANAAKQLGVERSAVEHSVQALCYVLVRAASVSAPADQVLDGIDLTLQPEALETLRSFYETAATQLAEVANRGVQLPSYHSLEWRLQVQVGGRHAVAGELKPSFLLRLHTEQGSGTGDAEATRTEHMLQARIRRARRITRPCRTPEPSPSTTPSTTLPPSTPCPARPTSISPPTPSPARPPFSPHRPRPEPFRRQADFANLRHLTTELDAALREEGSTHSRRIARRF